MIRERLYYVNGREQSIISVSVYVVSMLLLILSAFGMTKGTNGSETEYDKGSFQVFLCISSSKEKRNNDF